MNANLREERTRELEAAAVKISSAMGIIAVVEHGIGSEPAGDADSIQDALRGVRYLLDEAYCQVVGGAP